MHALIGLLTLIGIAGFIVFAFRQGTGVRRDDRPDHGVTTGWPGGSDSGSSHDSGGGFGHGS
jgi:hypothetical protein